VKNVLLEALLVGVAAALLAFAANAVSNRGLALTRNYFDTGIHNGGDAHSPAGGTNATAQSGSPLELLAAQGIRLADSNQVIASFHDPRFEQGLVAFIDARKDEEYQSGHIPGAWQFNHIYPEKYMGAVLPACQVAQEVVVYCNGGNCEFSAFAAAFLASAGVPKEKLSVYAGGITEWTTNGMPVELGERKSGRLAGAGK
jgi:rhodanese-related sulfurtransferase